MPNNIDERIVEMQFNNKNFEKGVSSTIGILDKLKQSLNFEGSVKGFEELDKAANKIDTGGLGKAIESVKYKFGAMEVAAISALSHITTQAVDAGEKLIKSFTLDPIMQGWDKYESKVASVQKIVNASADNTMDRVTDALDKIEWFTNETSYQFDAMVSTLGSFSAAGIKLEDATKMIIGLANAAAISGVNAKDASHGFIGFQRAIGSGYLSLGIWNSYLKTAGFQSEAFIKGCIKAALQVGTLTGTMEKAVIAGTDMEVTVSNFGETLAKKWVDSDVINTMAQNFSVASDQLYDAYKKTGKETFKLMDEMSGSLDEYSLKAFKAGQETKTWGDTIEYVRGSVAQTWSKTWEIIFGNYEEATEFFSTIVEDMYTLFIEANNERNEFLTGWKASGGRTSFLNGLINSLRIVINIVGRVKDFFAKIIPPATVEGLVDLTRKFEELTVRIAESLGVEDIVSSSLGEAFGLLGKGIDTVISGLEKTEEATEPVVEAIKDIDEIAKAVIRGDYGNGATRIEKLGNAFYKVQNRVNELLGCSFRYGDELVALADKSDALAASTEGVGEEMDKADDIAESTITRWRNISDTFRGVVAIIQILGNAVSAVIRIGQKILPGLGKLGDGMLGVTGNLGDFLVNLKDFIVESDIIYKTLESIYDAVMTLLGPALEKAGELLDKLAQRKSILGDISESLGSFELKLPKLPNVIENIITAIGKAYNLVKKFFTGFKLAAPSNKGAGFGGFSHSLQLINVDIEETGFSLSKIITLLGILAGGLVDKLSKKFEGLSTVFGILKEYWDLFMKSEVERNIRNFFIGAEFGGVFGKELKGTKIFPFVGEYFEKNWDFGKFATVFSDMLGQLSGSLPTLNNFTKVFGDFSHFITFGIDLLKTTFQSVGPVVEMYMRPFLDFLVWAVDTIKQIDFNGILRIGILVTVFAILFEVARLISKIGTVLQSVVDVFYSIYSLAKSFILKNWAGIMVEMALAIVIIGYTLYKLTEVAQDADSFNRACNVVIAILALLVFVVAAMGKLITSTNALKSLQMSGSLLAISAAIGILVAVLYFLKDIEWTDFWESCKKALVVIAGLAVIFIAFTGVLTAMNNFGKGPGKRLPDWKTMAGFYIFVMALQKACEIMAELAQYDFMQMLKGMTILAMIAFLIVGLSATMQKIKFTGSLGILMLVGTLWLFVKLIDQINKYDYGMLTMGLMKMLPIFAALILVASAARLAGAHALGLAAMMLVIVWSVDILAGSVKKIATALDGLGIGSIIGALIFVFGALLIMYELIGELGRASALFNKGTGKEMLKAFGGLALALLAVAIAIKIISTVDWAKSALAAVELGAVIWAFGKACQMAGKFKADLPALITMVSAIAVIAISLAVLSYMDVNKVLAASIAMGIVFGAFGFMMSKLKVLSGKTITVGKELAALIPIVGILLIISVALWNLAQYDWQKLLAAAVSMSLVMAAIGLSLKLMQGFKIANVWNVVTIMGMVLGGVAAALAAVLSVGADADQIMAVGTAITMITGVMTALFAFLSFFADGASRLAASARAIDAATGPLLAAIGKAVGAITGVLFILFAFNEFFKWATKDTGSIDILANFGKFLEQLAEIFGHIIGSLGVGLTAELPRIGENIGKFANGIKPLIETFNANKVTWETVVTNTFFFLEAIKNLNKASVQGFDQNLLTKNITSLASSLTEFWKALSDGNVDIGRAKTAADALSTLTSIEPPKVEGDSSDWDRLSEGLERLGDALVAFDQAIGGENAIDPNRISKGFALISQIGSIVTHIDTSKFEGWRKLIGVDEEMRLGAMGERSTGSGLHQMAIALKNFDNVMAGTGDNQIDPDRLKNVFEAIRLLSDVAKEVPNAGGIIQEWMGGFSWSTLYDGLVKLGKSIRVFSVYASRFDDEGLTKGLDAVTQLSNVAKQLGPVEPGFMQWFLGDDTLGGLAKALKDLTPQLTGFIESMKGYYVTDVGPAFAVLRRIVQIPETFKAAGINPSEGGMGTLTSIGYALETFATHFANMYTTLKGIGDPVGEDSDPSAPIRTLLESVSNIFTPETVASIQAAGEGLSKALTDGLNSEIGVAYVNSAVFNWVSNLVNALIGEGGMNYTRYTDAGHAVAKAICDALSDAQSIANGKKAADDLIYEIIVHIRTLYGGNGHGMYGAGQFLVSGLIAGMESKREDLIAEAQSLADEVNNTMTAPTGFAIDSPSKVWYKFGEFLDAGLSNGISGNSEGVLRSARYLASSINGEFQKGVAYSRFSPVVDISNARSAVGNLNNMFDASRAAALSATMEVNSQVTQFDQLVDLTTQILGSIQNGSDLYLDDSILAGRINRRLGAV